MRPAADTVAVVFPHTPPPAPADPATTEGTAAEAIRAAEASLARQNSVVALVDLQVVTAVLNAHTTHADGTGALQRLQREIEAAVATRTDLDTPAGARSFQQYLIDRLHAIRTVVETTNLDDSSRAALAAALSSLYATSASPDSADPAAAATTGNAAPPESDGPDPGLVDPQQDPATPAPGPADFPVPVDLGLDDALSEPPPEWQPWAEPTEAPAAALQAPPAGLAPPGPSWGAGLPGAGVPGAGLPTLSGPLLPSLRSLGADLPEAAPAEPTGREGLSPEDRDGDEAGDAPRPEDATGADDPNAVLLPSGEVVTASSPALAGAIGAALAGTPIPEAFGDHGITLPEPGSPVVAPLDPDRLSAGDIGVLTDRHAVALGNGQALLDGRIIPTADVSGPGFLGWLRPPDPEPAGLPADTPPPAPPATVG